MLGGVGESGEVRLLQEIAALPSSYQGNKGSSRAASAMFIVFRKKESVAAFGFSPVNRKNYNGAGP